ncbi:MAG: RNA polymerase sigma-70 factor [Bacteroides sp.]|nr:RNA polymerase sigma-70 factor [Bacteroides sp.]
MKPINVDYLFGQIIYKDDERAFQELFFDFFGPLCVFAHRYIPDKATCEDVVQDVFFLLWKNRKKIVIKSSARNFLITNVRNACIDYLRRREVETAYAEKVTAKDYSHECDTETIFGISELEERINAALTKLPDNVRQSFEMNRFDDKTYTQIAEECSISVKTVESHISKALKILREELKDCLPFLLLFLH